MSISSRIREMRLILLEGYGPQGWWPILSKAGAKGFDSRGYHKGIYDYPKTREQRFEMVAGAILTQNTSWRNVEKALSALHSAGLLSAEKIISADEKTIAKKIVPAGYYNQKAKKLKNISRWFLEKDGKISKSGDSQKEIKKVRDELLKVNGVGPETADSILLYAYRKPIFVVDLYTKRLFHKFKFYDPKQLKKNSEYDHLQMIVHRAFRNEKDRVAVFNEFHALIVERGKFESIFGRKKAADKILMNYKSN